MAGIREGLPVPWHSTVITATVALDRLTEARCGCLASALTAFLCTPTSSPKHGVVTAWLVSRAGPQRDPGLADPSNTERLAPLPHPLLAPLPSATGQAEEAALGGLLGSGEVCSSFIYLFFLEKLA